MTLLPTSIGRAGKVDAFASAGAAFGGSAFGAAFAGAFGAAFAGAASGPAFAGAALAGLSILACLQGGGALAIAELEALEDASGPIQPKKHNKRTHRCCPKKLKNMQQADTPLKFSQVQTSNPNPTFETKSPGNLALAPSFPSFACRVISALVRAAFSTGSL